jgi:tetratricopeptide (TPR) repeat protein
MGRMFDAGGAATTLSNAAALPHWNGVIDAVFRHAAAAPEHLAATLEADPGFTLAHAVKGLLLLTLARAELRADAARELATARRLAEAEPVTGREEFYILALAEWLKDQPGRAAAALDRAIEIDPADALAAKMSHAIRFMMGDAKGMLAAARRHRALHGEARPWSGYILGLESFAAEELGDFAGAERLGRQALELNPADAWARHAVAHVYEMTGCPRDGLAWLTEGHLHRAGLNNFGFHLSWHEALFQLELGENGRALALYDSEVRARRTDDYRDIANAASLLQRLELAGVHVGDRWEELADIAATRVDDRCLVFADLHYALALAGAGRTDDLAVLTHAVSRLSGDGYNAMLSAGEGALLVRAVAAFRAGHFAEAARLLAMARPTAQAIGGSNAQRDVIEQLLIESLVRSGDIARAEAALRDRLAERRNANSFASRRLARLMPANANAPARIAATIVGLMPVAADFH